MTAMGMPTHGRLRDIAIKNLDKSYVPPAVKWNKEYKDVVVETRPKSDPPMSNPAPTPFKLNGGK